jgi:hypothetical protein
MLYFRLVVGATLLLIFSALCLGNAYTIIASLFYKRHVSAVPFVGGVVGSIGVLVLPIFQLKSFWWVPLVADYGCVPIFIVFFVVHAVRTKR